MPFLPAIILLVVTLLARPATALPNLVQNGSFEQGFTGWSLDNPSTDTPAVAITYGAGAAYPIGAYGEPIPVPNIPTLSPDPAGSRGAYFVGDFAKGETLSQSIYLNPGLYRVGFSLYVPQNGQGNRGDATLTASLLGLNLADLKISTTATKQWLTFTGIAPISFGGQYLVSFVFNTNFLPSKDVIIDQVYVAAIPAPAALGLFAAALAGFAALRFWRPDREPPLERASTKG